MNYKLDYNKHAQFVISVICKNYESGGLKLNIYAGHIKRKNGYKGHNKRLKVKLALLPSVISLTNREKADLPIL